MDSLFSLVSWFRNRKWCFEIRQCKVTLALTCLSALIAFEPSVRSGIWKEGKVSLRCFQNLYGKTWLRGGEGVAYWLSVCRVSLNCIRWRSKKLQLFLLWEKLQPELHTFLRAKNIQPSAVDLSETMYHKFSHTAWKLLLLMATMSSL